MILNLLSSCHILIPQNRSTIILSLLIIRSILAKHKNYKKDGKGLETYIVWWLASSSRVIVEYLTLLISFHLISLLMIDNWGLGNYWISILLVLSLISQSFLLEIAHGFLFFRTFFNLFDFNGLLIFFESLIIEKWGNWKVKWGSYFP